MLFLSFFVQRIPLLTYATLACILGIYSPNVCFLLLLVTGILAIAWCLKKNNALLLSVGIACVLTLFACIGSMRFYCYTSAQQLFFETMHKNTGNYIVTILSIDDIDHIFYRKRITARIVEIHQKDSSWLPADHSIYIYTKRNYSQVADIVAVTGCSLQLPTKNFNNYLLKEGVVATVFLPDFRPTLLTRPTTSIARWIFSTKKSLLNNIKHKMSRVPFYLFSTIFLGHKPANKQHHDAITQQFNSWGVTHYLARSGLHMVIFIIIWQFLIYCLPIAWLAKECILLLLGVMYCVLSWQTVAFNRAFLTFILYKLLVMWRIPVNFIHALSLICLLILLHNPMHIFFLDFQLSFGLTLCLGLFNHIHAVYRHTHHQRTEQGKQQTIASA